MKVFDELIRVDMSAQVREWRRQGINPVVINIPINLPAEQKAAIREQFNERAAAGSIRLASERAGNAQERPARPVGRGFCR